MSPEDGTSRGHAQPPVSPPRAIAAGVLVAVETRDAYSNAALDAELRKTNVSQRDAALATELVYGVLKNRVLLDEALSRWLKKPLAKLDPFGRAALRIGAYQLLFLDRVPDHAAISETVSLVKARKSWLAGLTNAVLRRIGENRTTLKAELDKAVTSAETLSRRYGLPRSLAAELIDRLGLDGAVDYAEVLQSTPPVTLRTRPIAERHALAEELRRSGVTATLTALSPAGIHIHGGGRPASLAVVRDGRAVVQSEGSQLCGLFAAPPPGSRVLDLCAGRGGKTFLLADLMNDTGSVVATDAHTTKLDVLEQTAKSLALSSIRLAHRTRGETGDDFSKPFDLVLIDAPCSGAGNLRRHPELRWKLTPKRLDRLVRLQRELLERGAGLVKPGGLLVYMVCSDRPAEGAEQTAAFLSSHPDFHRDDPPANLDWTPMLTRENDILLLPHLHGTDGFYAARLRRSA